MRILILGLLIAPQLVLGNPGYKKCIDVPSSSTPLNETWYREAGLAGLHIVKHSRCNNCEDQEEWKWLKGRTAPKRYCWAMEGSTQYTYTGVFKIDFICEYTEKVEMQNCVTDFSKHEFDGVNVAGLSTITMTDNENYFAGVICLLGRENFWWIASITPDLNSQLVAKIEKHYAALGFTAPVATEDDGAKVVINKLTIISC